MAMYYVCLLRIAFISDKKKIKNLHLFYKRKSTEQRQLNLFAQLIKLWNSTLHENVDNYFLSKCWNLKKPQGRMFEIPGLFCRTPKDKGNVIYLEIKLME